MTPINPKNANILNEFLKLIEQIKIEIDTASNKKDATTQSFRLRQVQQVVNIIAKYPHEIKSGEQLKEIKGVGQGTISRINEILKTGKLSEIKIEKKHKEHLLQIEELEQIIGIGRRQHIS